MLVIQHYHRHLINQTIRQEQYNSCTYLLPNKVKMQILYYRNVIN